MRLMMQNYLCCAEWTTCCCCCRCCCRYHEADDAALFASWGVDYLKYDNCFSAAADVQQRYKAMRDALNSTGRPI
jgi:alpha-galactosidase